jgi:hypothetical protein
LLWLLLLWLLLLWLLLLLHLLLWLLLLLHLPPLQHQHRFLTRLLLQQSL